MPVRNRPSALEAQAERNAEARRRIAEWEAAEAARLTAVAAYMSDPEPPPGEPGKRRPGRPRIYTLEEARQRKKEQARLYNRDPINQARANELRRRNRAARRAADPAAHERHLEGERRRRNERNRQWRINHPEEHRARLAVQRAKRAAKKRAAKPPRRRITT